MQVITPLLKVDLTKSPDIDDPNHYCRVCKKTYGSRKDYRRHVKHVHKMELQPDRQLPRYAPDMAVDENDPENKSCATCKLKFV